MSYYRTKPLIWTNEVIVTSGDGISSWALGSYYELIAAAAAGGIEIKAYAVTWNNPATPLDAQFTIGLGAAGSEVPSPGHTRYAFGHASGDSILNQRILVPVTVPAGTRVAVAGQTSITPHIDFGIRLGYTVNDTSTEETDLQYFAIPDNQDSLVITPSGVSWTYSNWLLMTSGLATDAYLTRCIPIPLSSSTTTPNIYQAQVALGDTPDSGIISTFKGNSGHKPNAGQARGPNQGHAFPRGYPVNSGTKIWTRIAQSNTDTTDWKISLEALTAVFLHFGKIRVNKVVVPVTDTTQFTINTSGGLAPSSIILGSGGSYLFDNVAVGSGYGVLEDVPPNWSVEYNVSNGSQIDNISVADTEEVVVTITNTLNAPLFGGIYKIVPDSKKPNDTLWTNLNDGTTQDVAIPRPSAKLAPIGN